MLLADRVALVTGASRGIGRAIAERFAQEGAAVVLVARSEGVLEVAESIRAAGGRATAVRGDLADAATVKDCIARCRGEFGRLDVLVNNAGAMPLAMLGMIAVDDARRLFDLNVLAPLNLMQVAARLMKAPASIINVSSIARHGMAGGAAYSASKAAIVGLTLAAAKELAPRGIRVNALAPGFIDTEMTGALAADKREAAVARIGMGRIGTPLDVANAALFLASDLSAYVTGQVLGVDGAMQL